MKNSNNHKLSLQKKLVVKLNNDLKNNATDRNNKFNGNLPTNPLDGMKNGLTTGIESYWCGI